MLKKVGYYGPAPGARLPHAKDAVDPTWEPQRKPRILIYLRAGHLWEPNGGKTPCPLCAEVLPKHERTDGVHQWPDGIVHLVERHAVKLPDDFVAFMEKHQFRVPKVDVKMLKISTSGVLDKNPMLAAMNDVMTTSQPTPAVLKRAHVDPITATKPRVKSGDLDDSTAALPYGHVWTASVIGIATPTPLLDFEKPIIVGRDKKDAQLVIAHGSVSRRHCRLVPGSDAVIVQDLDSQNGVVVRGKKVMQASLRDGESFELGPARIAVKRKKG